MRVWVVGGATIGEEGPDIEGLELRTSPEGAASYLKELMVDQGDIDRGSGGRKAVAMVDAWLAHAAALPDEELQFEDGEETTYYILPRPLPSDPRLAALIARWTSPTADAFERQCARELVAALGAA